MSANRNFLTYNLMLLPGMALLLVFSIAPMAGVAIAFEKFYPTKGIFGSQWIGLENVLFMFRLPTSRQVFVNTIVIAVSKIVLGIIVPVIFALLLNEMNGRWFKKTVQTVVYLPHFLSWVILSGVLMNMLLSYGVLNQALAALGLPPQQFLASNTWFRPVVVLTDTWREFGFGSIVYLAAITAINQELYESAAIDGASRFRQVWHVTIPGMLSMIILMATLSLSNVLNAGFEQIFNLYNPLVYETGDIIDTYVYRVGIVQFQYGLATAVGLLKSVISFILIVLSYVLADRFANYRIF